MTRQGGRASVQRATVVRATIIGAGRGQRLVPTTADTPDWVLDALAANGVDDVNGALRLPSLTLRPNTA